MGINPTNDPNASKDLNPEVYFDDTGALYGIADVRHPDYQQTSGPGLFHATSDLSFYEMTPESSFEQLMPEPGIDQLTSEMNFDQFMSGPNVDQVTSEMGFDQFMSEPNVGQATSDMSFDQLMSEPSVGQSTTELNFDPLTAGFSFDLPMPELNFDPIMPEFSFDQMTPELSFEQTPEPGLQYMTPPLTQGPTEDANIAALRDQIALLEAQLAASEAAQAPPRVQNMSSVQMRTPPARKRKAFASPASAQPIANTPQQKTSPARKKMSPKTPPSSGAVANTTTPAPSKKRARKTTVTAAGSPAKRVSKTTKKMPAKSTPAPATQGVVSGIFGKQYNSPQRLSTQTAFLTADPSVTRIPVAQLLDMRFDNLSQHDKARLLLPVLNGEHPLEAEALEQKYGLAYGTARMKEAAENADKLVTMAAMEQEQMDAEASVWVAAKK
ncbi:hypothetical protein P280DRAFT_508716 [Massarina eburnea CBS 473.64]|uniref:Uncharacterized protein n=1 Tax=Massarina eburnea CBS 473.64 TaxID=1395130 RepID=A0A6A6RYG7_9PLEO|nr:hypothetical protein P280DRAFT_508716 [Massarina eburnea CBS 473.64]